jgi:hypothetical protein
MFRKKSIWLLFIILVMGWGCKDPYISPYKSPTTGYLVVEGYISGNSVTNFTLTRTIPLPGDSTLPTVDGATVQVQGSDNSTVTLIGQGNGVYSSVDTMTLNPQVTYRLYIKTPNGEQYQSDYVPFITTPPIDSVNFVERGDRSVQIYVNTHGTAGGVGYYQWNYDFSYEYHSAEESGYYYDIDTTPRQVVARNASNEVYSCWVSGSSTNIIIANSLKLSSDVIYEQPVVLLPPNDISTSVLYSILVREYALTAGGYNFLSLMQQNTESLGSIFDAQPSQITGNIHCLTVPTEQVLGYVSAGTVTFQRMFLYRYEIASSYNYSCPIPDTPFTPSAGDDSMQFGPPDYLFTPVYLGATPAGTEAWYSNWTSCIVCTFQGGTTNRPSFWPAGQ